MKLSVIIVTRNRVDRLRATLDGLLEAIDLPRGWWEVIVVDNGSRDGTAQVAVDHPLGIRVIRRPRNEGVAARNHAFGVAEGDAWLLLDDDSLPLPGTVAASLDLFDQHPDTAAIGGRVELPDGTQEASALPTVMIHCGVMLRALAVREVGGLPWDFRRQAEEYDLAFRFWRAGWRVQRYEDLIYLHDKTPGPRRGVLRWDVRNNLVVADRYLPPRLAAVYRADWLQRYTLLARHHHGTLGRFQAWRGRLEGRLAGTGYDGRLVLGRDALEAVFGFDRTAEAVTEWSAKHRIRRVALGRLAKNTFAAHRACQLLGLDLVGVLDGRDPFVGQTYRGLPIVRSAADLGRPLDGVVLTELNPAQITAAHTDLHDRTGLPVLQLWQPQLYQDQPFTQRRTLTPHTPALPKRTGSPAKPNDLRAA
ncbi:MAG: glycosyltransferase [Planctomycetota bacterium]